MVGHRRWLWRAGGPSAEPSLTCQLHRKLRPHRSMVRGGVRAAGNRVEFGFLALRDNAQLVNSPPLDAGLHKCRFERLRHQQVVDLLHALEVVRPAGIGLATTRGAVRQPRRKAQALLATFFNSHSRRRGHPASIHANSSTRRQKIMRPMRTCRGTLPAESQLHQVRSDVPHKHTFHLAWRFCGHVVCVPTQVPGWHVCSFIPLDFDGKRLFCHRTRDKFRYSGGPIDSQEVANISMALFFLLTGAQRCRISRTSTAGACLVCSSLHNLLSSGLSRSPSSS